MNHHPPQASDLASTTTAIQRMILGDCIETMEAMPAGSVDVVVTSPPYNVGIRTYANFDDTMPYEAYLAWMKTWLLSAKRVLKDSGHLWLNLGITASRPWLGSDVANLLRQEMCLQNHIAWVKSIHVAGHTHGHVKPLATTERYFNQSFEHLYHFTKDGARKIDRKGEGVGVPMGEERNKRRFAGSGDLTCCGSAWFVPYETTNQIHIPGDRKLDELPGPGEDLDWPTVTEASKQSGIGLAKVSEAVTDGRLRGNGKNGRQRRVDPQDLERWRVARNEPPAERHSVPFPAELPERCIRASGFDPSTVVLDPMAGEGNTLVAARRLGVCGIGIDNDPRCITLANDRMRRITGRGLDEHP